MRCNQPLELDRCWTEIDRRLSFCCARKGHSGIGRGEGFIAGFLEETAPQGGKITLSVWHAAFSGRFSEPIHVSQPQKFEIDSETDKIVWTETAAD